MDLLIQPQNPQVRSDLQKDDNRLEGVDIVNAQRAMYRFVRNLQAPPRDHRVRYRALEQGAHAIGFEVRNLRQSELLHLRLLLIDVIDAAWPTNDLTYEP